jgi:hypothetical protein
MCLHAADLTQAYRLPVDRVAMRFGVTVISTRGSVCQRARDSSTCSATLAERERPGNCPPDGRAVS